MEEMTKRQKERVESLVKIIQENPNLPILPLVAYEVVSDDGYDWSAGELGECYVDDFYIIGERVFLKRPEDWDEVEKAVAMEYGQDEFENMRWCDVVRYYDELPWTTAIILDINPIEGEGA